MSLTFVIKDFKPENPREGDLGKWDNTIWLFKSGEWQEAPEFIEMPAHNTYNPDLDVVFRRPQ